MVRKEKSRIEIALDEYFRHFGQNYPLCIGKCRQIENEIITSVKKCIEDNTPMEEPVYEDGCDY